MLLWLVVAVEAVPVLSEIGVYLWVDRLTLTQQVSGISIKNFMVSQVKMLCNFTKATYRIASFIRKGESR